MATAKKTTTKSTTARKTTAAKMAKPKLEIVKPVPEKEMVLYEKMVSKFPAVSTPVDLGDGMTVNVRSRVGLQEMALMVRHIVDTCVDEERGEINFELFDYVTKLVICSVYCGIEATDNPELGYAAICGKDRLYDQIYGYIDYEQLNQIWDSAKARLKAKQEMFSGAAAKLTIDMIQRMNELTELISGAMEGFDADGMAEALKKLGVEAE